MRIRWVLAVLCPAAVSLGWVAWERTRPAPGLPEIAAALGERRLLEPRLTGGFAYAPCEQVKEEGRVILKVQCSALPKSGTPEYQTLNKSLSTVGTRAARGGTVADLQTRAAFQLLWTKDQNSTEQAIKILEDAAELAAEDARVLNDLAVAHFVLAQQLDEPSELIRALSLAERAVREDPTLLEALFNRALLLDTLFLKEQAREAWNEYLASDDTSDWAREAHQHLSALEELSTPVLWASRTKALREAALRGQDAVVREIVTGSPQAAREYAIEDLLGEWGESILAGRKDDRPLRIARVIGRALRDISGDPSVQEAVRAIAEKRGRFEEAEIISVLARGHRAYRDASRYHKKLLVEQSAPFWIEARDALAEGGSPVAFWAELGSSGVDFYSSRFDQAFSRILPIATQAEASGYLALAGRSRWALGLIRLRQGRFSESLAQYRAASQRFESARELENLGTVHVLIAENLQFVGQSITAWRHRYQALALLSCYPSSMRLHNALWDGGTAAVEEGEPVAGLFLQNEGLAVAEQSGDPGMVAEALLRRSEIHLALEDLDAATQDLEEAQRLNASFKDQAVREKLDADITYAKGNLWIANSPRRAMESFSEALDYYQANQLSLELVRAYSSRAQSYLALGQEDKGEEDLSAALEVFENQRSSLADDDFRASYSEAVQNLFDEMILLQARRGRPEEALETSERARTVPLAKTLRKDGALSLSTLLREMPTGVVFVEYALVRDRLLIWVVQRDHVTFTDQRIERESLEREVKAFVSYLRSEASPHKIDERAARLYKILIPPEVRSLRGSIELCFIPDKILSAIPFAALKEEEKGQYLIERHPVVISPSITSYLKASLKNRSSPKYKPLSALLVGATVFDRSLFSALKRLPGADVEIKEIQQLYPGSRVISGEDATKRQILEAMGEQEVLQFSGHSVFNSRYPAYSYLVVAPSPDRADVGMVFAHEIAESDLRRLHLVVLSACESLGPLNSRTAGLSGTARPFLDAGVSAVLGSLWNANDQVAAALIPEFHRRFVQTGNLSTALQGAQLLMLRGAKPELRSPTFWGAFAGIGASN